MSDNIANQDPVCGIELGPEQRIETLHHEGRRYYFCSTACRDAFRSHPEKYLKPKGFISRLLTRLAQAGASEPGGCPT